MHGLHILNLNENDIKTSDSVVKHMEFLHQYSPLQLCYATVYSFAQTSLEILFNNARSFQAHYHDVKSNHNVQSSDILGFAESRIFPREKKMMIIICSTSTLFATISMATLDLAVHLMDC